MSDYFLLVKKSNVLQQSKIFLNHGKNSIGRKADFNTIVLPEAGVSRSHCVIEVGDSLSIEDLGSGNGTLVNGKKISGKMSLKSGDSIVIGDSVFSLMAVSAEGQAKPVKPVKDTRDHKSNREASKPVSNVGLKDGWGRVLEKIPGGKKGFFAFCGGLLLIVLIIFFRGGAGEDSFVFPTVGDVKQLYVMNDPTCKFLYPASWRRLEKDKENFFGFTFLERSILFFGTRVKGADILFCVDVLDGIPSSFGLKDVVSESDEKFPRLIPHEKVGFSSRKDVEISGKKAVLLKTPRFKMKDKYFEAIEAFILDNNRRFFLIGFAPSMYFKDLEKVFEKMILSFSIEPWDLGIPKPSNALLEVNRLIQSADSLVDKRQLKASNLYLACKDYKKACFLFNLYAWDEASPLKSRLMKQFQFAEELLDVRFGDLKFAIEKGLKVNEDYAVFKAAKEIMSLVPDTENKMYQYADRYYSRLRKKFEN